MNLFLFHNLTQDPVIAALLRFRKTAEEEAYFTAARGLIAYAENRLTDRNLIQEYVLRTMLEQENLPDIASLRDFLRHDVKTIYQTFMETDWEALFREKGLVSLCEIPIPPRKTGLMSYVFSLESLIDCNSNEALGGAILAHTESFGTGTAAAFAALFWDGERLSGIPHADPVQFSDLTGLERQKQTLMDNTERFLCGAPANDMLLTGACGTGKSASIKACLNLFQDRGLRLVELKKPCFDDLARVLASLHNPVLKYIVFLDDLDFAPDTLASVLDGQTAVRGSNVLIYATGSADFAKKDRALASRFGTHVSFPAPTRDEYLKMVENLQAAGGVELTEEIQAKALAWENDRGEASGRLAKQFVASMIDR